MLDLETELRLAEQSKESLKERVKELVAELDKIKLDLYLEQEKRGVAEKERDEAQKKVEELQTQIESLKLENTNLKFEASNGKWQASRLNERYIDACVKIEELEAELEKMGNKLTAERSIQVEELEEELQFEKARFHAVNIEREEAVKENGALHKEIEKMAVENHALNAQCNHLTDELLRITKAHDELQKEEFKRRINELFSTKRKVNELFSQKDDAVNHPSHYTRGSIECIEAIKASMAPEAFKGYLKGNAMKYVWRYKEKGYPQQDLEKAAWYLRRLSDEEGEE